MHLTWNRINPKMSQDFLTFLLPRIKCFLTIGKMVNCLVEYGGLMVYMSQFYNDYIYIWQNGSECWNNSPKKKKKKLFVGLTDLYLRSWVRFQFQCQLGQDATKASNHRLNLVSGRWNTHWKILLSDVVSPTNAQHCWTRSVCSHILNFIGRKVRNVPGYQRQPQAFWCHHVHE